MSIKKKKMFTMIVASVYVLNKDWFFQISGIPFLSINVLNNVQSHIILIIYSTKNSKKKKLMMLICKITLNYDDDDDDDNISV